MINIPTWTSRPKEVANLINPAYCALLIHRMSTGYKAEAKEGLPLALVFLALPLVLNSISGRMLPQTTRTKLHVWLSQNPEILLDFAEQCRQFNPYVRESLSFAITHRAVLLEKDGKVTPCSIKGLGKWEEENSNLVALKQALLIGKLFGQVNDVTSLFSMLGVRP